MTALLVHPHRTLSQVLLLIAAVLFLLGWLETRVPTLARLSVSYLAWCLVAVSLMVI